MFKIFKKQHLPIIDYKATEFEESHFVYRDLKWKASTYYKAAKDQKCKPFDLPLAGIDLNTLPFNIKNFDDFVFHVVRVKSTSLKHPIMLDCDGTIVDGWHRIAKALIKGRKTIKAIRLKKYVEPDYNIKDE